jgi:hypothetical protein
MAEMGITDARQCMVVTRSTDVVLAANELKMYVCRYRAADDNYG